MYMCIYIYTHVCANTYIYIYTYVCMHEPRRCKTTPRPRQPGRAQCKSQRRARSLQPGDARAMPRPAADLAPVAPSLRNLALALRNLAVAQAARPRALHRPAASPKATAGRCARNAKASSGPGASAPAQQTGAILVGRNRLLGAQTPCKGSWGRKTWLRCVRSWSLLLGAPARRNVARRRGSRARCNGARRP